MNYPESIDWLFSTQMFGIKLGLDGPRRLLRESLAFPAHGVRVIHVAGTNGKGSTCAMIDALVRATGTRCGLFTSPHLIDFRERMRVSGREIPEERCAAGLTELREICERLDPHPTFFEITLALAMRWFRECECECVVLETGMGGRLDATTAVPADVTVLTPIALDHMQWLGDTLEKITLEKCGILIEGKPLISAPQQPTARRIIEMEANQRRSPLEWVNAPLTGYHISLEGPHQRWNAAAAVAAAHHAGYALSYDTVRQALGSVSWPGRFERFTGNWNGTREIILDGAHNPQSAEALATAWNAAFQDQRATLLFSAVENKDHAGIIQHLAPLATRVIICPVDTPRAVPPDQLAAHFAHFPNLEIHPQSSFAEAFATATSFSDPILVAGSLFLVGEARAHLAQDTFQPSSQ